MANALWRLTKSLYNTPHLITPEALEQVETYLLQRNKGMEENSEFKQYSSNLELSSASVGVVNILGPLTYRADYFEALCGMTSYQTAVKNFDAFVQEGKKTIVLYADGPGGEAYGAFETGTYFRNRADEEGIKLISYVDGSAFSATYALASSAHEVIINPEAMAGSIGVVVSLMNNSKNLEKNGYSRMFVFAGDNKIPYDEEGNFKESFLGEIQNRVDNLYQNFISYVADMRGITEDSVKATKAGVFDAESAKEIGLINNIMTRQEFNRYISSLSDKKTTSSGVGMTVETDGVDMNTLQKQLAELQDQNSKLMAEVKNKAIAEMKNKAIAWEFAGVDADAYAVASYEGSIPVEMFDAALDAAKEALAEKDKNIAEMKESLEGMESLGDEVTEEEENSKVDGVEAALAKLATEKNIKLK